MSNHRNRSGSYYMERHRIMKMRAREEAARRRAELMGIFGESASRFDEIVEKVTAEHQSAENWELILDICDKINSDPRAPKLALTSIRKRLNNRDPHVIMLALSVLDSCWSNCGSLFRKEVSSATFINELMSKATHSTRQIGEKTRLMLKKWVDNECKADSSLSLVSSLYRNLIEEGFTFDSSEPKKKVVISNDPNVVQSEEEEKDIARAIALSLQEEKKAKTMYPSANGNNGIYPTNGVANTSNLYPSLGPKSILKKVHFDAPSPVPSSVSLPIVHHSPINVPPPSPQPVASERTVRALYDFEAAEDNELSFVTGDLITVTDDSNPNWWRGRIGVQQGLFPASFVTSDLSEVKPETSRTAPVNKPAAVIDEAVLLKCIQLIEDCDPTGDVADPPELAEAEAASLAQGPLIDARLAAIDKQSNALAQVDIAIRDVLALYDQAVQQANPYQQNPMYGQQQQQMMMGQQQQANAAAQQPQYLSQYVQQQQVQPQQSHYQQYGYQQQYPMYQQQQPQYAPQGNWNQAQQSEATPAPVPQQY